MAQFSRVSLLHSRLPDLTILGLALWLRLTNLYALPAFVDEAIHLLWAQRLGRGLIGYPAFVNGKLLMGVLVSLFQPYSPAPLWIARSVAALLAIVSCAACIGIGKQYGTPVGRLAGLLYAILPFAVFHERQILSDSLMISFGSLSVFFTLRLNNRAQRHLPMVLGTSLAAAFLTKFFFGLEYLAYLFFAALLIPRTRSERISLTSRAVITLAITALLIGTSLALFTNRVGLETGKYLTASDFGFVRCPPLLCQGDFTRQFVVFQTVWQLFLELLPPYFGWPLAGLAGIGLIIGLRRGHRGVAVLGASFVSILAFYLTSTGGIAPGEIFLPPRYLLPLALPLVIIAAYGLSALWRAQLVCQSKTKFFWRIATGLLLAITLGPPAANTLAIVTDPWRAAFPPADVRQYFTENGDGAGFREAALVALACLPECEPPPAIIAEAQYNHFARAHIDRTRIELVPDNEATPAQIGQWLLAGQPVLIIDQIDKTTPALTAGEYQGLNVEEVGRFGRPDGKLQARVLRVIGVTSALRAKIFDALSINPDQITGDYQTLLAALPSESVALLVYPPTQARALAPLVAASQPPVTVIPIGDTWPLNPTSAANELQTIIGQHPQIRIAFLDETASDPQRQIETWLTTHLFRADEQWHGPIRVVTYVGEGTAPQTIAVNAKFGDNLTLQSIELFDSSVLPGGWFRIRVDWHADTATPQPLKFFAHIFAGDSIIAQHDGQPLGELRPTTTWQPGEAIHDQFAIRIPPDAPPGLYQIRIGVYDLMTQERLPAKLDDGSVGDFFVGGQITVK